MEELRGQEMIDFLKEFTNQKNDFKDYTIHFEEIIENGNRIKDFEFVNVNYDDGVFIFNEMKTEDPWAFEYHTNYEIFQEQLIMCIIKDTEFVLT